MRRAACTRNPKPLTLNPKPCGGPTHSRPVGFGQTPAQPPASDLENLLSVLELRFNPGDDEDDEAAGGGAVPKRKSGIAGVVQRMQQTLRGMEEPLWNVASGGGPGRSAAWGGAKEPAWGAAPEPPWGGASDPPWGGASDPPWEAAPEPPWGGAQGASWGRVPERGAGSEQAWGGQQGERPWVDAGTGYRGGQGPGDWGGGQELADMKGRAEEWLEADGYAGGDANAGDAWEGEGEGGAPPARLKKKGKGKGAKRRGSPRAQDEFGNGWDRGGGGQQGADSAAAAAAAASAAAAAASAAAATAVSEGLGQPIEQPGSSRGWHAGVEAGARRGMGGELLRAGGVFEEPTFAWSGGRGAHMGGGTFELEAGEGLSGGVFEVVSGPGLGGEEAGAREMGHGGSSWQGGPA